METWNGGRGLKGGDAEISRGRLDLLSVCMFLLVLLFPYITRFSCKHHAPPSIRSNRLALFFYENNKAKTTRPIYLLLFNVPANAVQFQCSSNIDLLLRQMTLI